MKKHLNSSKTNFIKVCFTLIVLSSSSLVYSQTINANWKQDLTSAMKIFLSCQDAANDNSIGCNQFLGESLHTVYKVNDFYSQKLGRYMVATEIASFLKSSNQWKLLGPCYEQKILTMAQEHANAKKAVVAVYTSAAGSAHVVLITPGQLQSSGSWGLSVPAASSFLLSQPDRSFVDKGLSFAFSKLMMKDVSIYVRNY